jgi:hypothetical protein
LLLIWYFLKILFLASGDFSAHLKSLTFIPPIDNLLDKGVNSLTGAGVVGLEKGCEAIWLLLDIPGREVRGDPKLLLNGEVGLDGDEDRGDDHAGGLIGIPFGILEIGKGIIV